MQASRATTVGVLVIPLLVTAATVGMQFCSEPQRSPAPAIAATADRYTVAWMRPAKHGGALLVQQFARDTLTALGPPRAVVERDDLEAGGVEIVAVADGYVVTSRVDDPEGPMGATNMIAVPLDGRGDRAGTETTYHFDYACHGLGLIDDRVVLAYDWVARSHKHPNDTLGVMYVDRDGDYVRHHVIAYNPRACAIAVHGRELAVVWTRMYYKEESREYANTLHIAFETADSRIQHDPFKVPVGDVAWGPARVARYGDEWAVLYAEPDGSLHVALVDNDGALLATRHLPAEVDAKTVDLATNARGAFVTWVEGDRVRSLGIDSANRTRTNAGSRASRTRALGDGSSCVTVWTVGDGKQARIARSADCP